MENICQIFNGDSPLVATAIHDGHELRPEVARIMALSDSERLREEDPFTAGWTTVAENRVVGIRSRFEVDLNRPREKAVYIEPEDAWGLPVWNETPSKEVIKASLRSYDAFYDELYRSFSKLESRFERFVVFDLHSYNHRREGPDGPIADPQQNPEVNIGTGTMDRMRWAPIIEKFIADLGAFDFLDGHLDVRENIKFKGGQLARWTHENFPRSACVLSIEFKKFFMDEWSGDPSAIHLEAIHRSLQATVPGVLETLRHI
ncbi:MAG: N-formylglutamate amidohydrolase [Chloroflexi bacterium]|nr:MAG: N-formylglutamate amidohydrolase [Chloroflexota bacterium]MBL1195096.1 N-formylglutamate amidohydrolase [Chloroflexota bacterium]NOH12382.1 N-formylglutamate amidohydrolase [Chloroflexota bacterium]